MRNQIDTVQEINSSADIVRDLLDSEIMLVGGGDGAVNAY